MSSGFSENKDLWGLLSLTGSQNLKSYFALTQFVGTYFSKGNIHLFGLTSHPALYTPLEIPIQALIIFHFWPLGPSSLSSLSQNLW